MRKSLLPLLLFLGGLLAAGAQTPSATLDAYVAEGLQSNLALKGETLSFEKSLRALEEARGLFLPTLNLDARYSRAGGGRTIEFPVGDLLNPVYGTLNQMTGSDRFPTLENVNTPFLRPQEHETKLRLVQPIVQPGLHYNYQIKSLEAESQQAAVQTYRRQLEADIRTGYFNYLKAVKATSLYRQVQALQQANLRLNQKFLDNQKITADVVYAAKADLADTELKIAEAEKNRVVAAAYFNFLLNKPLDAAIEADTTFALADAPAVSTDAAVVSAALQNREELAGLRYGIQAATRGTRLYRGNALPTLSLVVDYGFQGTSYRFTPADDFIQGSLVLNWNLFGGLRNRSKIAQADLDKRRLETQYEALQAQIRLQSVQAAENLATARQALETNRQRVASARRYHEIVDKKYREGAALYVEYLAALTTLTNASSSLILAEYDYQVRQVEFKRVTAQ
jgi:outer membrane protein TolC